MNSLKRIYLSCRATIAELGPVTYLLSLGIMVLITTFIFFANGDTDQSTGQLRSQFSFWDPESIISLLMNAGWISGLIVCGTIYNRAFKEENQAIRSLSLPLSNGERFATMMVMYLGFVPLVCFGLPLLFVFLVYPFAPDSLLLPSATYLWKALMLGSLAHAATCAIWLQPAFAFGKKIMFVLIGMAVLVIVYIVYTHGSISDTVEVPYVATAAQDAMVAGLAQYEPQMTESQGEVIKIEYNANAPVYYAVQILLLLLMLAAGGLALTKKTT